ncbi:hypothetical protein CI105_08155 [Candidatus Izimaplasma bacterium ZiA1]|uniref:ATP-grasp fold amidoligase family protein n=1 Tax=Candidatus Izimoplasma sp. ZiA1 TaxID=2024899 RepID=UPI000BAA956F|nr:hypothetical protein CI105_08155 [Candidatus Izimaplasma bacterium ZiA1]
MNVKRILMKYASKISFLELMVEKIRWRRKYNLLSLSDYEYAHLQYKKITGKDINLENPKNFNEKIWFLKLAIRDDLLTKCADKDLVRDYVKEVGLQEILINQYGVYKDARDIDFNALPSPSILKCNHTSGYNFIYNKGEEFNKRKFVKKFNFGLSLNYYVGSREWHYKNIERRIIAEEVIKDNKGNLPKDYKFLCFMGEPKLLLYSENITTKTGEYNNDGSRFTNIYDLDLKLIPATVKFKSNPSIKFEKPENFDLMIEYARILSKPFRFVRVDLYNVDGKIYFGELTFYHGGGLDIMEPIEYSNIVGQWINIVGLKISKDAYIKDIEVF